MDISSLKYGQQEGLDKLKGLDNTRLIILPNIPLNAQDLNLGRMYTRAMKPTTFQVMYSRWLASVGSFVRRGRTPLMIGNVDVLVLNVTNQGLNYAPVAYTAAVYSLIQTVLSESEQIQRIEFRPIVLDTNLNGTPQPLVMTLLRPSGYGLLEERLFNSEDVGDLLAHFVKPE